MASNRPAQDYGSFEEFFIDLLYKHASVRQTILDLSRIVMTKNMRIDGLALTLPITEASLFKELPDLIREYFLKYTNQNSFLDLTQTYYKEMFASQKILNVKSDSEYDFLTQADGSVIVVEKVKFFSYCKPSNMEEVIKPVKAEYIAEAFTFSRVTIKNDFVYQEYLRQKIFVIDEITGESLFNTNHPDVEWCYQKSAQEIQQAKANILLPFEVFGICKSFSKFSPHKISIDYFNKFVLWNSINGSGDSKVFGGCSLHDLLRIHKLLTAIQWEKIELNLVKNRFDTHHEIAKKLIREKIESYTNGEGQGKCPGENNNLDLQIPTVDETVKFKTLLRKYAIYFDDVNEHLDIFHQTQEITAEIETFLHFQSGLAGALQEYEHLKNTMTDILQKIITPKLAQMQKDFALGNLISAHSKLSILTNQIEQEALKKAAQAYTDVIEQAKSFEVVSTLSVDELNDFVGCGQFAINIITAIKAKNYEESMAHLEVFKKYINEFAYGKVTTSTTKGTGLTATGAGTAVGAGVAAFLVATPIVLGVAAVAGLIGLGLTIGGGKSLYDAKKGQLALTADQFIKEAENFLAEVKKREEKAHSAYRKRLEQTERNRFKDAFKQRDYDMLVGMICVEEKKDVKTIPKL